MKRVAKPVFFIVALILVLFACASFLGFNSKYGDIDRVYLKGLDDIEWVWAMVPWRSLPQRTARM